MKSIFLSIICCLLILVACKKETVIDTFTAPPYYNYYPLEVNKWIEYSGDSIYFNDVTGVVVKDTVRFNLREDYESIYNGPDSLLGDYRIFVSIQYLNKTDTLWHPAHTWYAERNNNYFTKTEENLRFMKLNFPLQAGKKWNGTTYLPKPDLNDPSTFDYYSFYNDWMFKCEYLNQPETIGAFAFDSITKINEVYDSTLVTYKNVVEKYAYNVGMVEKNFSRLISQAANIPGAPFAQRAENGYITHWKIKAYN